MKSMRPLLITVLALGLFSGCTTPIYDESIAPQPTPPLPFPPDIKPHRSFVSNVLPKNLSTQLVAPIGPMSLKAVIMTPGSQVKLLWNPSPDPSAINYNLYIGPASGTYTNVISVGNVTNYTVMGLQQGITYFFVVTATGPSSLESLPSNEVGYTVPIAPPIPATYAIQVSGTDYDESDGAYWQPTPTNVLSSYTNNSGCYIVYQTNLWRMTFTNKNVLYTSANIISTNWTKVKGTNDTVHTIAIGNPLGAPQPTSILMSSFIVYWGLPSYNVYVTGDLTQPWTFLTNTAWPYIFVSRAAAPQNQFFKIETVITNTIQLSPQN